MRVFHADLRPSDFRPQNLEIADPRQECSDPCKRGFILASQGRHLSEPMRRMLLGHGQTSAVVWATARARKPGPEGQGRKANARRPWPEGQGDKARARDREPGLEDEGQRAKAKGPGPEGETEKPGPERGQRAKAIELGARRPEDQARPEGQGPRADGQGHKNRCQQGIEAPGCVRTLGGSWRLLGGSFGRLLGRLFGA